jgi:transposase InsO family protein
MQNTIKDQDWQDQKALERYTLIAPLLDETLDPAKRSQMRSEIAERAQISERTLYRYEEAHRKKGFSGLKPVACERSLSKKLPDNYLEIVGQAIQLKKEVPKRSVEQIIFILEQEGWAAPNVLKRSTLERYLYKAGFGVKQMQMYRDARESSSKRFCKPHRMMLLQGDIKYGCKLPIGKNGALVQTYLSSAIDDHSRYVIQSEFYDNQEETIVEDTFRKAVLKAGKFDAAYFDNGAQYVARQLKFSMAKLGITIRLAPLRSGKSKGKIEKFHQVVDSFLREVKIHKIKTMEELNHYWSIYLEEYYHKVSHDGIREYYESLGVSVPPEGITPLQEWNRDSRALVFLDTAVVAEAFLHHEQRLVDKGACISFQGRKYETKPSLIGFKVEISYDPSAPETITVHYPGMAPFTAHPLKIGAFCDKNPTLPVSMQETEPESSRFLNVLQKKQEQSRSRMADAISFGQFRKDGGGNV